MKIKYTILIIYIVKREPLHDIKRVVLLVLLLNKQAPAKPRKNGVFALVKFSNLKID